MNEYNVVIRLAEINMYTAPVIARPPHHQPAQALEPHRATQAPRPLPSQVNIINSAFFTGNRYWSEI